MFNNRIFINIVVDFKKNLVDFVKKNMVFFKW